MAFYYRGADFEVAKALAVAAAKEMVAARALAAVAAKDSYVVEC